MTERQATQLNLAYHEAAHVVMAHITGLEIEAVVFEETRELFSARVVSKKLPPSNQLAVKVLINKAACLLAGRVGESLCDREAYKKANKDSTNTDQAKFDCIAKRLFKDAVVDMLIAGYNNKEHFKQKLERDIKETFSASTAKKAIREVAEYLNEYLYSDGRIEAKEVNDIVKKVFADAGKSKNQESKRARSS